MSKQSKKKKEPNLQNAAKKSIHNKTEASENTKKANLKEELKEGEDEEDYSGDENDEIIDSNDMYDEFDEEEVQREEFVLNQKDKGNQFGKIRMTVLTGRDLSIFFFICRLVHTSFKRRTRTRKNGDRYEF